MSGFARRLQQGVSQPSQSGGGGSGTKPSAANTGAILGGTMTEYDTSGASGVNWPVSGTNFQNLIFTMPVGTAIEFTDSPLTIKNCIVRYPRAGGGYSGPPAGDGGVVIGNGGTFNISYLEISGGELAFAPSAGGTSTQHAVIDHCYVHDTDDDLLHIAQYSGVPSDSNTYIDITNNYFSGCYPGTTGSHSDACQIAATDHLTFQNNVFIVGSAGGPGTTINDCFYEETGNTHLLFTGNWLSGGQWGWNGEGNATQTITNNVFTSGSFYYDTAADNNPTLPSWSGNVYDTGGTVTLDSI
jgi:hypothetical protein